MIIPNVYVGVRLCYDWWLWMELVIQFTKVLVSQSMASLFELVIHTAY
jgi:hypothetical protein